MLVLLTGQMELRGPRGGDRAMGCLLSLMRFAPESEETDGPAGWKPSSDSLGIGTSS